MFYLVVHYQNCTCCVYFELTLNIKATINILRMLNCQLFAILVMTLFSSLQMAFSTEEQKICTQSHVVETKYTVLVLLGMI